MASSNNKKSTLDTPEHVFNFTFSGKGNNAREDQKQYGSNISEYLNNVIAYLQRSTATEEERNVAKIIIDCNSIGVNIVGEPKTSNNNVKKAKRNMAQEKSLKGSAVPVITVRSNRQSKHVNFSLILSSSLTSSGYDLIKDAMTAVDNGWENPTQYSDTIKSISNAAVQALESPEPIKPNQPGDPIEPDIQSIISTDEPQLPVVDEPSIPTVSIEKLPEESVGTSTDKFQELGTNAEELPPNVIKKIIGAIRKNPALETINDEKQYYFLPDTALRAIVADGSVYGLGNTYLAESRIIEALPGALFGIKGFFRPHFRVNLTQFESKKKEGSIDPKISGLLDMLMVNPTKVTNNGNGSYIHLLAYNPSDLDVLREVGQAQDTEFSHLQKFYGGINTGDAKSSRTLVKGFFLSIPSDYTDDITEDAIVIAELSDTDLSIKMGALKDEMQSHQEDMRQLGQEITNIDDRLVGIKQQINQLSALHLEGSENPGIIMQSFRDTLKISDLTKFGDVPGLVESIKINLDKVLNRYLGYEQMKTKFEAQKKELPALEGEKTQLENEKLVIEGQYDVLENQIDQAKKDMGKYRSIISERITALQDLMNT